MHDTSPTQDPMACSLAHAPWHADPYPLYAGLRERQRTEGLFFDPTVGAWVAATADAVQAALQQPGLVVRPTAEPVPAALAGRPAGEVFGGLMRMNEGPRRHGAPKAEVEPWLATLCAGADTAAAAALDAGWRPGAMHIDDLLAEGPLVTLAGLLGQPPDRWAALARDTRRLVRAWAAGADASTLDAGDEAAVRLMEHLGGNANRVGLFTQTCDATAGLVGNALVAWQRGRIEGFAIADLEQVARDDPSVHNTRRWAAHPLMLLDRQLELGDPLIVLLASALRDTSAGPGLGWGAGRHACPGQRLSLHIASALLRRWHAEGPKALREATARWSYRRLPNARIPRFQPGDAA